MQEKDLFIKATIVFLVFSGTLTFGQVQGVSSAKLSSVCADPLAPGTLEFEPAISYSQTKYQWNEAHQKRSVYSSPDSMNVFSDLSFRFTYGVMEKLEVGLIAPSDVSFYALGLKYKLVEANAFALAGIIGTTVKAGNKLIHKKIIHPEEASTLAGGLVISNRMFHLICMDIDIQYQQRWKHTSDGHKYDLFFNTDMGVIYDNFQFVAGIYYHSSIFDHTFLNQEVFTLNLGITLDPSEKFAIAINTPIDIWGKNHYKTTGLGLAITFLWD